MYSDQNDKLVKVLRELREIWWSISHYQCKVLYSIR